MRYRIVHTELGYTAQVKKRWWQWRWLTLALTPIEDHSLKRARTVFLSRDGAERAILEHKKEQRVPRFRKVTHVT